MSETVARQRPPVDLDDFERRFRQTQRPAAQDSAYHLDDPLAELARIVGDEPDPYGEVFAQPAAPMHAAQPGFRPTFAPHGRQEPSFGGASARDPAKPHFLADFAAIEAGLRGAMAQPQAAHFQEPHFGHERQATHDPLDQDQLAHPHVAPGQDMQPDYAEPDYAFPPEPRAQAEAARTTKRRSGLPLKPAYAIAGSIAIAVVGIGVAFAYKGVGSSPREIKTIMAAAGPTKVQPPADAKADATEQDAQSQAAPTKLVSREEQPVDLEQAVQDNAARDAASRGTDAASVPVPEGTMSPDYSAMGGAKATETPATGSVVQQPYSDQGFGVGMPLPKKVKSVMVKPDGTIVSGGQDTAAAPAPAAPAAPAGDSIGALAGAAAPAPATPKARAKGAKATARVAIAAPVPAADPTDGADSAPVAVPAPAPVKPGKKTKPVKVATAETGTEQQAGDDAKPSGNGAFAVQLGAPGSEAEARSATSKFLKKYAGALHGQRLGFHRADSNGKTVYRIRVSSLSKADATSLCAKLKADGGTCFVAKN